MSATVLTSEEQAHEFAVAGRVKRGFREVFREARISADRRISDFWGATTAQREAAHCDDRPRPIRQETKS